MKSPIDPAVSLALVLVAGVCLAGCTPASPDPAPTPRVSADPTAQAAAAAEATYRAYVDALNARRDDPTSQPDPMDFLAGDALSDARKSTKRLESKHLRLVGRTRVISSAALRVTDRETVVAVCIDSTNVRLLNEHDDDVTPANRSDVGPLEIHVTTEPNPVITESLEADVEC